MDVGAELDLHRIDQHRPLLSELAPAHFIGPKIHLARSPSATRAGPARTKIPPIQDAASMPQAAPKVTQAGWHVRIPETGTVFWHTPHSCIP